MEKTLRDKIEYIINNYGQATSEGNIYWDVKVNIPELKNYKKRIVTRRHPLDCIIDEILELFDKR